MEAKEDITDQSAIKNDNKNEREKIDIEPQATISCCPLNVTSNIVQVSKRKPQIQNDNVVLSFRGSPKVINDDTRVSHLKEVVDNWFSMYYYYHLLNQKLVNEQNYFQNSMFQYWQPIQNTVNSHNSTSQIRWYYCPQHQHQEHYCTPAILSSNTQPDYNSPNDTPKSDQLPWRCRTDRRLDHTFKFFQNYNAQRGQKTLVFKKREVEQYHNGKFGFRNESPFPKEPSGYKYAQNLNNSISRRVSNSRTNYYHNPNGTVPYYELCDSCTKTYKPTEVYTKSKRQPRSFIEDDDQKNDIKVEPFKNGYSNLLRKQSFKIEPGRRSISDFQSTYSEKSKTDANVRKHPVQLLCELYGKNGLQIECEFICSTPFRKQKVTYTVMGRKFTAISHTRDEAKRLCAKKVLMTLHPELQHELQEDIPKREYDFGYRLNRRHPVDLVNYFFKNEAVLIETEKKGLSHFTSYTVYYTVRGKKFVATAEKQNEAKRRCALLVLNDFYGSNDHYQ